MDKTLPDAERLMFEGLVHETILTQLIPNIHITHITLPKTTVYARKGHYRKVGAKPDKSKMIEWSDMAAESERYSRLADATTMSSLVAVKDEKKERLTIWPQVQNMVMPEPTYTDLPYPSHFGKLQVNKHLNLTACYFAVDNMFHNIRPPITLIPYR